jgi:hypothetical protein
MAILLGRHLILAGALVGSSRYYAWAVLDVENWSSRPAVTASSIQQALRQIETQALASAGIDTARVARQPRGDGAILALPGDIAKEVITTEFVEALREGISEYDANCSPDESIRLRLALHAGEALEGEGEWAGQPVVVACRLVDSSVIKRVLAAATGCPLALIVSSAWYDAVVREGYVAADGYREVWVEAKTFADFAWVKTPGRTSVPGLLPADDAASRRASGSAARSSPPSPGPDPGREGRVNVSGNAVTHSTVHGGVVFGNQYNHRRDPDSGSGQ